MFRLRAGYFPAKESNQSSPGLRARTPGELFGREAWRKIDRRGCRLVVVLLSPPAAALRWMSGGVLLPLFRGAPSLATIAGCGVFWRVFGGRRNHDAPVGANVLIGPFRWCAG